MRSAMLAPQPIPPIFSVRCFLFLLLALLSFEALKAQDGKDVLTLEPGKPIERELDGGQSHSYRILLTAGQYVHIVVDQRGIDVVVTLVGPDGTEIAEVDTPNG